MSYPYPAPSPASLETIAAHAREWLFEAAGHLWRAEPRRRDPALSRAPLDPRRKGRLPAPPVRAGAACLRLLRTRPAGLERSVAGDGPRQRRFSRRSGVVAPTASIFTASTTRARRSTSAPISTTRRSCCSRSRMRGGRSGARTCSPSPTSSATPSRRPGGCPMAAISRGRSPSARPTARTRTCISWKASSRCTRRAELSAGGATPNMSRASAPGRSFDPESGALLEYFDAGLRPVEGEEGRVVGARPLLRMGVAVREAGGMGHPGGDRRLRPDGAVRPPPRARSGPRRGDQ